MHSETIVDIAERGIGTPHPSSRPQASRLIPIGIGPEYRQLNPNDLRGQEI